MRYRRSAGPVAGERIVESSPEMDVVIERRDRGTFVDHTYRLKRETALGIFAVEAEAVAGTLPEGATPCLMRNSCNNTEGNDEVVFRSWNSGSGEVVVAVYPDDEACDIVSKHLQVGGIELPPADARFLGGFDPTGSGYMEGDGLALILRQSKVDENF